MNEARTFAPTGTYDRDVNSTNQVSVTQFIIPLEDEMKKASDIAISFDAAKLPMHKISTKPQK